MRTLVLWLAVAACGGNGKDDDDTDGVDTDGADTDDTDIAPSGDAQAVIRVLGFEVSDGVFGGSVIADFYRAEQPFQAEITPSAAPDSCEVVLSGTGGTGPTGTTPAGERPFGGVVSVQLDGVPVPMANGVGDLAAWPTGQTLSVSASGSTEVGAFDEPALLVVPEPPTAALEELVNGAYRLTWSGASTDDPVLITIPGSGGTVKCVATDDGSFDAPPSDVQLITPAGSALVSRSVAEVVPGTGVTVTGWAYVTADAD